MSYLATSLCSALPEAMPAERRKAARYAVNLEVEVMTVDGVPLSSEITNISAAGFRTRSPMALAKGTKLSVRFHKGRRRRAFVAWQIGEDVGCHLLRPLREEELSTLLGC